MGSETRKCTKRRDDGRFDGFRVNCEVVPCLPARIVAQCLSDPRRIPYLLFWRHRYSGVLKEVVRLVSPYPNHDWLEMGWVEVKRGDGNKVSIRLAQIGCGSFLVCNFCQKPRRTLYAWETNEGPRTVIEAGWPCRICAGLSYASEGGTLVIRSRCPALKPLSGLSGPRPRTWDLFVFTSPKAAVDAGLCSRSSEMPSGSIVAL
jgi:hypothetical protein